MRSRASLVLLLLSASCGRPVPQSAACAHFVACVRALDQQRGRTTNLVRFEADGPCWGSEAGARLCTESCERGLPWLVRDLSPAPEACQP